MEVKKDHRNQSLKNERRRSLERQKGIKSRVRRDASLFKCQIMAARKTPAESKEMAKKQISQKQGG